MDQLTERLGEYAQSLSYEDLPPEVVERTKRLILDTVGAPWVPRRGRRPPSPAPWPQTCSPAPRPR